MEYVTTYKRTSSPYWVMTFYDATAGKRRTVSTKLRHDNPTNDRKLAEMARKYSQAAIAIKPVVDQSGWNIWAPQHLKEKYHRVSQTKTLERMERCYRALEMFFEEKGVPGPAQVDANTPSDYVRWRTTTHPRRSGKLTKVNTALTELKCLSILLEKA